MVGLSQRENSEARVVNIWLNSVCKLPTILSKTTIAYYESVLSVPLADAGQTTTRIRQQWRTSDRSIIDVVIFANIGLSQADIHQFI